MKMWNSWKTRTRYVRLPWRSMAVLILINKEYTIEHDLSAPSRHGPHKSNVAYLCSGAKEYA